MKLRQILLYALIGSVCTQGNRKVASLLEQALSESELALRAFLGTQSFTEAAQSFRVAAVVGALEWGKLSIALGVYWLAH